jgi:transposase InsO family protein
VVEEWIRVCDVCQQNKLSGPGYGELPPQEALFQPWYEVAIDRIGPWLVIVNGESISMHAITMIDTVTNLVELFRIDTPSAANAAWAFEMAWLFCYPRPVRVIHDQANEFQGMDFQVLLQQYGIEDVPTSVQIHKQMLRVSECIRLWATFYELYCTPILQLVISIMMSGPW